LGFSAKCFNLIRIYSVLIALFDQKLNSANRFEFESNSKIQTIRSSQQQKQKKQFRLLGAFREVNVIEPVITMSVVLTTM